MTLGEHPAQIAGCSFLGGYESLSPRMPVPTAGSILLGAAYEKNLSEVDRHLNVWIGLRRACRGPGSAHRLATGCGDCRQRYGDHGAEAVCGGEKTDDTDHGWKCRCGSAYW